MRNEKLLVHPGGAILVDPGKMRFARCLGISGHRVIFNGNCSGLQCPFCGTAEAIPKGAPCEALLKNDQKSAPLTILPGKTVVPGLCDAHVHFITYALTASAMQFPENCPPETLLQILQKEAPQWPEDKIIFGFGFGRDATSFFEKLGPDETIRRIMKHSAGRHVLLASRDLHSAIVSMNPSANENNENLGPGLVRENTFGLFRAYLKGEYQSWLLQRTKGLEEPFLSQGITWLHNFEGPDEDELIRDLRARGHLRMRFASFHTLETPDTLPEPPEQDSGCPEEGLFFLGFKCFGDGSMGSLSAALQEPYLVPGPGDNRGILLLERNRILKILRNCSGLGGLAIHGIGDRATLEITSALGEHEKQAATGFDDHWKNRLEHAQSMSLEALEIMKESGHTFWASVQPLHMPLDYEACLRYLGPRRTDTCYPLASLIRAGCRIMNSTDAPVVIPDLIRGIRLMLNRGQGEWVWNANEAITLEEMIASYTTNPAEYCGCQKLLGNLEKGALADMAVLSLDLQDCQALLAALEKDEQGVIETWIAGERVWSRSLPGS